MAFWRWAEERIEAAIQAGEFEALSGQGQRLPLEQDPWIPPEERLARHIMHNAGVKPAWVELAEEIQSEMKAARVQFLRAASSEASSDSRERTADQRFERRILELNTLIKRYNLIVPHSRLARSLLDPAVERERLLSGE